MGNVYADYNIQNDVAITLDATFLEENSGSLYRVDPNGGTIILTLPNVDGGMWFDVFKISSGTVLFEASGGATIRQTDLAIANIYERIRVQINNNNEWNVEGTLEEVPSVANTLPTGWWRYDIGMTPSPPANPYNQNCTSWVDQGSVGGAAIPSEIPYPFSSGANPKAGQFGASYSSRAQNFWSNGILSDYITPQAYTAAVVQIVSASTINDTPPGRNPGSITDSSGGAEVVGVWGLHVRRNTTIGPSGFDSFYAMGYHYDGSTSHVAEVLVLGGDHSSQGPYLQVTHFDNVSSDLVTTVWNLASKSAGAVLVGTHTVTAVLPDVTKFTNKMSIGNNSGMINSTHTRITQEALTWPRVLSAGEIQTVVDETLARWGGV